MGPIVVVDGNPQARALASGILRRAGFVSFETDDVERVGDLVRRERAQLVLVEVSLPGISGYEICRRLRDEFGEQLPIVFMSAERTTELDRAAGLLVGADDYLAKPLMPDRLLPRSVDYSPARRRAISRS